MEMSGLPRAWPSTQELIQPAAPIGEDAPTFLAVSKSWRPYQDQWLEAPLPFLKRTPRCYYRWRWLVLYPFQWRLFRGLTTVGELLLILVLLAVGAAAAYAAGHGFSFRSDVPPGSNHQPVLSTGSIAQVPLLLVWTLACHNSLWTFLLGIPFERALFWHKLMVWLSLGLGAYHGVLGQLSKGEDPNHRVTGYALGGIMLALVVTAWSGVRRALFDWFYRSHWVLFIASAVVAVMHGASLVLIGVGLWGFDVVARSYMAKWKHAKDGDVARLPGDVVRIEWPREGFQYFGGQNVFICVPKISVWEWHPFSLSSHPGADKVTVHIRVLGDWTKRLYDLASQTDDAQPIQFLFEGPYGSPSVDVCGDKYQMFLLIAGGIGITPMQSMVNTLMADAHRGRPVKKVWLVWSVRDDHLIRSVLPHDGVYERKQLPKRLPTSFSPDVIADDLSADPGDVQPEKPLKEARQLHTEFYLTQVRDPSGFADANIQPELQPYLRFGRPDLPRIFEQMRELAAAYGETRVATLVCGPPGMIADVRRLSSRHRVNGVRFDCHVETFEL
ncbi:Ferric reductase [Klebsormidium nitens]|uniref:Ferric reductase n=1 Tax=Klebsormidium nitens TaxID=105231 RepID=A0A1Y1I562_KLENI|nr:Ferric reductase [Klebsormidium nitens]|eukprot:GAQ85633.1 Ferric reductase [Klebsormidium nitens]